VGDIPKSLEPLFWDVDPGTVRLDTHTDYVIERVMSRGTWDAMCWLRSVFDGTTLADFLRRKGERLPPRERAYWQLVTGGAERQVPGGGRPVWAGN
jgi:hypothetical protein